MHMPDKFSLPLSHPYDGHLRVYFFIHHGCACFYPCFACKNRKNERINALKRAVQCRTGAKTRHQIQYAKNTDLAVF